LFVIFHTNGGGELKMFKPRQRNTEKLQINLKDSTRAYNMIDGIFLKTKTHMIYISFSEKKNPEN